MSKVVKSKYPEMNGYTKWTEVTEIIKLCTNGDIFIKGKLIENDKEVVDAMREFLIGCGYLNQKEEDDCS
jgi:hypothetical protein